GRARSPSTPPPASRNGFRRCRSTPTIRPEPGMSSGPPSCSAPWTSGRCGSAALSVQYVGGSLAAPGWGDIIDWLARTRAKAAGGSSHADELAKGYDFITDVLPESGRISVRRARATIARISDAETHRRRG